MDMPWGWGKPIPQVAFLLCSTRGTRRKKKTKEKRSFAKELEYYYSYYSETEEMKPNKSLRKCQKEEPKSTKYSDSVEDITLSKERDNGLFIRTKTMQEKVTGGLTWWDDASKTVDDAPNEIYTANQETKSAELCDFLVLNEEQKYVLRDKKSPLIWTIGFIVMSILVNCVGFYYYPHILPFKVNPCFGFDETTMLLFGAKLGSLINDGEWWRFLTAMVVNPGILHMCIEYLILASHYDIELFRGFMASMMLFLVSGAYGFILSAIFVPEYTQCGANGALSGLIAFKFLQIIFRWVIYPSVWKIILLVFELCLLIAVGLLPFNDNFSNVGGLLMGLLVSLTLMPNLPISNCILYCRSVVTFLSFPIMATLFCVSIPLYYRQVGLDKWCTWCAKTICINISTAKWCPPPY